MTDFLETLSSTGRFLDLKSKITVSRNPKDDLVLATACDGEAGYVVSRDKHRLGLKKFRGSKIITVDEALRLLDRQWQITERSFHDRADPR